jgi:hypothetical protein
MLQPISKLIIGSSHRGSGLCVVSLYTRAGEPGKQACHERHAGIEWFARSRQWTEHCRLFTYM